VIVTILCAAVVVGFGPDMPPLLAMYLAVGCILVMTTGRCPRGTPWVFWQLAGVGFVVAWPLPVALELGYRLRGQ
jgi:hypothetical protein